jgi:DNA-binding transcriptional LysR family regulator
MNPTLRQMRAFVALAKTGNFTLAAQLLHLSQSALSGLIKELEATLGARVVDRSTRKISLTEIGSELYPLFSQIIDDLDGALANIDAHTRLKKGTVRVAAPQLMACTVLPAAIAAWQAQHPDVQVRLADCALDSVAARVLSGEADLGIAPEREPAPQLDAQLLFELPFALVFPKKHPLESRKTITWQDLGDYPFISLQGQFTERLMADMHGALREVTLKPAYEVAFMTTALAMVSSGLGIAVCLPYAQPLVSLYKLNMRPLEEPVMTRRFFVHTRPGRALSPAAEAFRSFLLDYVQKPG